MSFCYTFIGLHSPLYTRITFQSSSNISPYSPNGAFLLLPRQARCYPYRELSPCVSGKKLIIFCIAFGMTSIGRLSFSSVFRKIKKRFMCLNSQGILYCTKRIFSRLSLLFYSIRRFGRNADSVLFPTNPASAP